MINRNDSRCAVFVFVVYAICFMGAFVCVSRIGRQFEADFLSRDGVIVCPQCVRKEVVSVVIDPDEEDSVSFVDANALLSAIETLDGGVSKPDIVHPLIPGLSQPSIVPSQSYSYFVGNSRSVCHFVANFSYCASEAVNRSNEFPYDPKHYRYSENFSLYWVLFTSMNEVGYIVDIFTRVRRGTLTFVFGMVGSILGYVLQFACCILHVVWYVAWYSYVALWNSTFAILRSVLILCVLLTNLALFINFVCCFAVCWTLSCVLELCRGTTNLSFFLVSCSCRTFVFFSGLCYLFFPVVVPPLVSLCVLLVFAQSYNEATWRILGLLFSLIQGVGATVYQIAGVITVTPNTMSLLSGPFNVSIEYYGSFFTGTYTCEPKVIYNMYTELVVGMSVILTMLTWLVVQNCRRQVVETQHDRVKRLSLYAGPEERYVLAEMLRHGVMDKVISMRYNASLGGFAVQVATQCGDINMSRFYQGPQEEMAANIIRDIQELWSPPSFALAQSAYAGLYDFFLPTSPELASLETLLCFTISLIDPNVSVMTVTGVFCMTMGRMKSIIMTQFAEHDGTLPSIAHDLDNTISEVLQDVMFVDPKPDSPPEPSQFERHFSGGVEPPPFEDELSARAARFRDVKSGAQSWQSLLDIVTKVKDKFGALTSPEHVTRALQLIGLIGGFTLLYTDGFSVENWVKMKDMMSNQGLFNAAVSLPNAILEIFTWLLTTGKEMCSQGVVKYLAQTSVQSFAANLQYLEIVDKEFSNLGTFDDTFHLPGEERVEGKLTSYRLRRVIAVMLDQCSVIGRSSAAYSSRSRELFAELRVRLYKVTQSLTRQLDTAPREAPLCWIIFGQSSVGKTSINDMLFSHLCARAGVPFGEEYIWTMPFSAAYADRLRSWTTCMRMEDLARMKPNYSEVEITGNFAAFMDAASNYDYFPNMASLEAKGNVAFRAKFIGATTNVKDCHSSDYFSCSSAFMRRFKLVITVRVRTECANADGSLRSDLVAPVEGYADWWEYKVEQARIQTDMARAGNAPTFVVVQNWCDLRAFLIFINGVSDAHFANQKTYLATRESLVNAVRCFVCKSPFCMRRDCRAADAWINGISSLSAIPYDPTDTSKTCLCPHGMSVEQAAVVGWPLIGAVVMPGTGRDRFSAPSLANEVTMPTDFQNYLLFDVCIRNRSERSNWGWRHGHAGPGFYEPYCEAYARWAAANNVPPAAQGGLLVWPAVKIWYFGCPFLCAFVFKCFHDWYLLYTRTANEEQIVWIARRLAVPAFFLSLFMGYVIWYIMHCIGQLFIWGSATYVAVACLALVFDPLIRFALQAVVEGVPALSPALQLWNHVTDNIWARADMVANIGLQATAVVAFSTSMVYAGVRDPSNSARTGSELFINWMRIQERFWNTMAFGVRYGTVVRNMSTEQISEAFGNFARRHGMFTLKVVGLAAGIYTGLKMSGCLQWLRQFLSSVKAQSNEMRLDRERVNQYVGGSAPCWSPAPGSLTLMKSEGMVELEKVVAARTAIIYRESDQECEQPIARILGIRGFFWILNYHVFHRYADVPVQIVMASQSGGGKVATTIQFGLCVSTRLPGTDVVMIAIPSLCNNGNKGIVDFFPESGHNVGGEANVFVKSLASHIRRNIRVTGLAVCSTILASAGLPSEVVSCWAANAASSADQTQRGDCGSPWLVATEPAAKYAGSDKVCPMIYGIHQGGSYATASCAPVFRSQLLDMINKLSVTGQLAHSALSACVDIAPVGELSTDLHFKHAVVHLDKSSDDKELFPDTRRQLKVFGTLTSYTQSVSEVCSTGFRQFWEENGHSTTKVAPRLGWRCEQYAMRVMTNIKNNVPDKLILHCTALLSSHFMSQVGKHWRSRTRPLSWEEVDNGIVGVTYIDGTNMATSTGYPWNRPKSTMCTREYKENGDGTLREIWVPFKEVHDATLVYEQMLEEGVLPPSYFTAAKKDEPVSANKIERSRIFIVGSWPMLRLMRKYFLPIVRIIQNNSHVFCSYPGIATQSSEWQDLYDRFTVGEARVYLDGDFKDWDKRLQPIVVLCAFWLFTEVARVHGVYGHVDLLIMRNIAASVAHPVMVYFGVLLQLFGTNPSGHSLTVHINGFAVLIKLFVVFGLLRPPGVELIDFFRVVVATYGDDNTLGIPFEWKDWFNLHTIRAKLEEFGDVFTDGSKNVDAAPYKLDFSTTGFVKRNFIHHGLYVMLGETRRLCVSAPLELSSISKSLLVCVPSKTLSARQQMAATLTSAAFEMSMHGADAFNEFMVLAKRCAAMYDLKPTFRTYDEWFELWSLRSHANSGTLGANCTKYTGALDLCHEPQMQAEEASGETELVERPVRKAIRYAGALLSRIPFLGRGIRATSLILNGSMELASLFGFSNPPLQASASMMRPHMMFGTSTSQISSPMEKLSLTTGCELEISGERYGFGSTDQLSIAFLKRKRVYLGRREWASSTGSTVSLLKGQVNPNFYHTSKKSVGTATYTLNLLTMAPMTMLNHFFTFWRGSIVFTFKVYGLSGYHKGRLRFAWDPSGVPLSIREGRVLTKIIDVDGYTEVKVEIPYLQDRCWLATNRPLTPSLGAAHAPPRMDAYQESAFSTVIDLRSNGGWSLDVLVPLSTATTTSKVYIVTFVEGGADLEFALPCEVPRWMHTPPLTLQGLVDFDDEVIPEALGWIDSEGQAPCSELNLGSYLARPFMMYTGTLAEGATLSLRYNPLYDFLSLSAISARIAGYAYMRYRTLNVKMVMNVGAFRYIAGYMTYINLANEASGTNLDRFAGGKIDDIIMDGIGTSSEDALHMAMTQRKHCEFNYPTDTGCHISIPYINPAEYIPLNRSISPDTATDGFLHNMVTVLINSYFPLTTATTAVADPAGYSIYVWLDGVELIGPTNNYQMHEELSANEVVAARQIYAEDANRGTDTFDLWLSKRLASDHKAFFLALLKRLQPPEDTEWETLASAFASIEYAIIAAPILEEAVKHMAGIMILFYVPRLGEFGAFVSAAIGFAVLELFFKLRCMPLSFCTLMPAYLHIYTGGLHATQDGWAVVVAVALHALWNACMIYSGCSFRCAMMGTMLDEDVCIVEGKCESDEGVYFGERVLSLRSLMQRTVNYLQLTGYIGFGSLSITQPFRIFGYRMVMPRLPEWFGPSQLFTSGPRVKDTTGNLVFNYVNTPLYAMLIPCFTGWKGSIVWRITVPPENNVDQGAKGPTMTSLSNAWGRAVAFMTPQASGATAYLPVGAPSGATATASELVSASMRLGATGYMGSVYGMRGLPVEAVCPHYSAFKYHPAYPLAAKNNVVGTTDIASDNVMIVIHRAMSGLAQDHAWPEVDMTLLTHSGADFNCYGFLNVPTLYTIGPSGAGSVHTFAPATTN